MDDVTCKTTWEMIIKAVLEFSEHLYANGVFFAFRDNFRSMLVRYNSESMTFEPNEFRSVPRARAHSSLSECFLSEFHSDSPGPPTTDGYLDWIAVHTLNRESWGWRANRWFDWSRTPTESFFRSQLRDLSLDDFSGDFSFRSSVGIAEISLLPEYFLQRNHKILKFQRMTFGEVIVTSKVNQ